MNLLTLIEMIERMKPDYGMAVTQDTLLSDLGLSSLDMMILICELEQICGIEIQLDMLQNIRTVEQLHAAITKK